MGSFHFFINTPSKDGRFSQYGVWIFSSEKPTKFGACGHFFSKVPTKYQLFGFHFSKGADKKLRVRISAILGGGGGNRNRTKLGLTVYNCLYREKQNVLICLR